MSWRASRPHNWTHLTAIGLSALAMLTCSHGQQTSEAGTQRLSSGSYQQLEALVGTTFSDVDRRLLDGGTWSVRWVRIADSGGADTRTCRVWFEQDEPVSRRRSLRLMTTGDVEDVIRRVTGTSVAGGDATQSSSYATHLGRKDLLVRPTPSPHYRDKLVELVGRKVDGIPRLEGFRLEDVEDRQISLRPIKFRVMAVFRRRWHMSIQEVIRIPLERNADVMDLCRRMGAVHSEKDEGTGSPSDLYVDAISFDR